MKRITKRIIGIFLMISMIFSVFVFVRTDSTFADSDLPKDVQKRLNGAIVLYIGSSYAYVNGKKVQVDPSNSEVYPVVRTGKTLVPIRFISENLGATVNWDGKTSSATIGFKGKTIKLKLGSKRMLINNKESVLEVPADVIKNRIFVPLAALVQAFDKKIFYDRGLIIISDKQNLFDPKVDKSLLDKIINCINILPVVGSLENLEKLIKNSKDYQLYFRVRNYGEIATLLDSPSVQGGEKTSSFEKAESSASTDYSTTNVQVEGVDEADIVKTDGKYIYQVNRDKIVVAEVYPAEEMRIVKIIDFSDKRFTPNELYVDTKHLIVIGSTYMEMPFRAYNDKKESSEKNILPPDDYSYYRDTVKAIIYDITDKSNIKELRQVEIEGSYVSSRKIGNSLYLIANKNIYYHILKEKNKEPLMPCYRDTAIKNDFINIKCDKIYYFPGFEKPNYMIIAGINLDRINEEAKISTYLGSGEKIYASLNNLYVAVTNYDAGTLYWGKTENTLVYKFGLNDGNVTYLAKGEVPGTILNQFSMDEHNGYFRIATTKGTVWGRGENISKNNLYVLNDTMSIVGRLEGIAPGEKIYSTRFMGDRAYMVTFKKVDPLFVIDLKDPQNPKILGKLKIPGYSDYLHPYDDNHIIGFGKDTIEAKEGDFAWYQGMKIAIFDITDVNNPKEMFVEKIGDRGTDSELLYNHKALLFSKTKNLLAFPVTVMEIKNKSANDNGRFMPQYGEFTFQGAYVYNIDLEKGFTLRARITHISDDEYAKAGSYWYKSDKNVNRILYINDTLYTLSNAMIKAHDLKDMKEIKTLVISK